VATELGDDERPHPSGRRLSDKRRDRLLVAACAVVLFGAFVSGAGTIGIIGNRQQIEDNRAALSTAERGLLKASRALRQVCAAARRDHRGARTRLRGTRDYLRSAPHDDLYDAVRRSLPQTRAEVSQTRPPPYCKHPHRTLPPPSNGAP
jgi:hypothetical protein